MIPTVKRVARDAKNIQTNQLLHLPMDSSFSTPSVVLPPEATNYPKFCLPWTLKKNSFIIHIRSDQLLSRVRLFSTPWIAACQASLSIINSQSLPKPMSIELVMPSSHLILCCPLLLPPIPPSIRLFSNESTVHEVAKVLEFQPQCKSFQWTPRTDLL